MEKALNETPLDDILITNEWDAWDHVRNLIQDYLRDCEVEEAYNPNDLPFIVFFESRIEKKLIKSGFGMNTLRDKNKMERIFNELRNEGLLFQYPVRPGEIFPIGTFTISEDNRTFWIKPDIHAALRAWQSIDILKRLLVDNEAVKIYLSTFELTINLARAGQIPAKALQGFSNSKTQSERSSKPRAWGNMTPAERKTRDTRIRADYDRSRLTLNAFALRCAKNCAYAKGNGEHLSVSGIKKVLSKK
jgi:hypothetical protein